MSEFTIEIDFDENGHTELYNNNSLYRELVAEINSYMSEQSIVIVPVDFIDNSAINILIAEGLTEDEAYNWVREVVQSLEQDTLTSIVYTQYHEYNIISDDFLNGLTEEETEYYLNP